MFLLYLEMEESFIILISPVQDAKFKKYIYSFVDCNYFINWRKSCSKWLDMQKL